MFERNAVTKTSKQIETALAAAQVKVPAAAVKEFVAAFEAIPVLREQQRETASALEAALAEIPASAANTEQVKQTAGLAMASGEWSSAQASAAIREARDAEDLIGAKVSGLQSKAKKIDEELIAAFHAFQDTKEKLSGHLIDGIRKRMAEVSAPFAAAVRQCLAINDGLRLDLAGLESIRLSVDPALPDHNNSAIAEWVNDPIAGLLQPIRQAAFDTRHQLLDIHSRQAARAGREQETAHAERMNDMEKRNGTTAGGYQMSDLQRSLAG